MGNPFSKKYDGYQLIDNDLNNLIQNQVFTILDQNKDNIVTKDEFDNWNESMQNRIQKIKDKNKIIINQFKQNIAEKDQEIERLKIYIENLEQDKNELEKINLSLAKNETIKPEIIKSIISKAKVRQYVKKILQDENINIKHFPDAIEEAIYTNVIYMVLKMINNLTEKSEINIVDHTFRIVIN